MNLDVKQGWYTYKLMVEEEFVEVCKDIEANSDRYKKDVHTTVMSLNTDDNGLEQTKVKGQALVNILVLIDQLSNSPTVALLSDVYPNAYKILGVGNYDYYALPINKLLADLKDYEEKWNTLKGMLERITDNKYRYTLDGQEQETVQYVKQQLENMNQVESKLAEV